MTIKRTVFASLLLGTMLQIAGPVQAADEGRYVLVQPIQVDPKPKSRRGDGVWKVQEHYWQYDLTKGKEFHSSWRFEAPPIELKPGQEFKLTTTGTATTANPKDPINDRTFGEYEVRFTALQLVSRIGGHATGLGLGPQWNSQSTSVSTFSVPHPTQAKEFTITETVFSYSSIGGVVGIYTYRWVPGPSNATTLSIVDANVARMFPLRYEPTKNDVQMMVHKMINVRHGAAADGVSLLLLRAKLPVVGKVTFGLEGPERGGSLWPVKSVSLIGPGAVTFTTSTYEMDNKHYAFALFLPPMEFGPEYAGKQIREFKVSVKLRPGGVGSTGAQLNGDEFPIRLIRPPVVLVHGTYDNPRDCWTSPKLTKPNQQGLYQRLRSLGYRVWAVDYGDTSGNSKSNPAADETSRLEHNKQVVWANPGGIRDALNACRKEGYAVTQVDVVCHSLGGLVTRKYAEGFYSQDKSPAHFNDPEHCMPCAYHRDDNWKKGDIHRLITLSSTHMGSDICRFLVACQTARKKGVEMGMYDQFMSTLLNLAANHETGVFTGAFEDQIPESSALKGLGLTRIPVHAIASVAEHKDLDTFYRARLQKIWGLCTPKLLESAFAFMNQPADGKRLAELKRKDDELAGQISAVTRASTGARTAEQVKQMQDKSLALIIEHDKVVDLGINVCRMAVFGNTPNDCTVRRESSFGGLGPQYRTEIQNTLHGDAVLNDAVQRRVITLLEGPQSNFDPRGFPRAGGKPKDEVAVAAPLSGTNPVGPQSGRASSSAPAASRPGFASGSLPKTAPNSGTRAHQLDSVSSADLRNALEHTKKGNILAEQGKFAQAEVEFREAVRLDPKNDVNWSDLGGICMEQRKLLEAESAFRRAVQLKPADGGYHADLAEALLNLNKRDEAVKEAKEAIRLGEKNHPVFEELGLSP